MFKAMLMCEWVKSVPYFKDSLNIYQNEASNLMNVIDAYYPLPSAKLSAGTVISEIIVTLSISS